MNERRKRLDEIRALRLKQMREDREALLLKQEEERRRRERKITAELKNSRIVREANQLRRRANFYRDRAIAAMIGKEPPMDPEQARMMEALQEGASRSLEDKAKAIRNLKFTVGEVETEQFQRQMQVLIDKRLPYYIRHSKCIGKGIVLWTQLTYDLKQFITSIDIGHVDSDHPLFKDLSTSGYETVGHPALKFVFWVKRDPSKASGIAAIDFGFTEAEERTFMEDGFEMMGPSLFEYGLADSTVWYRRIEKRLKKVDKANIAVATNNAIHQLQQARDLLKAHPGNENLKAMEQKFIAELEECYRREQEAEIENPIETAKRLMALDDYEVDLWIDEFRKLDTERSGRVKLEHVFGMLEEHMTEVGKAVFTSMEAVDDEGYLEFGDFMLSVGTFCFFGQEEILKFLYTTSDKAKRGVITQADYIDLLNDLHPFDKAPAVRVLKVMKNRPDKEMTFDEFVAVNDKYPTMMFPHFRLQRAMRRQVSLFIISLLYCK